MMGRTVTCAPSLSKKFNSRLPRKGQMSGTLITARLCACCPQSPTSCRALGTTAQTSCLRLPLCGVFYKANNAVTDADMPLSTAWAGILADDMGLGKTLQAIALIAVYKDIIHTPVSTDKFCKRRHYAVHNFPEQSVGVFQHFFQACKAHSSGSAGYEYTLFHDVTHPSCRLFLFRFREALCRLS